MEKKRRVHFDEFMLDIHNRVHQLRLSSKDNFDSIPMVADTILEQSWLLCFDEFQVFPKELNRFLVVEISSVLCNILFVGLSYMILAR